MARIARNGSRAVAPDRTVPLLPSIGQATETLLDDYADPLIADLRKLKGTTGVIAALESDTREMRNAFHARQLCERLALVADALAKAAELEAAARLRELFAACAAPLQKRLFPEGLAPELAPRGQAQVGAVGRILRELAQVRNSPQHVHGAALGLATAALELSERGVASATAHGSLVQAMTAEQLQQYTFRQTCHTVLGALLSLHPDKAAALLRAFKPREPRWAPSGLPAAPSSRVTRARAGVAKRARPRAAGRTVR